MKNCLNCKYCKIIEDFAKTKDGIKLIKMTCFECEASETKQHFLKPVLNCKEYKKRGIILNE